MSYEHCDKHDEDATNGCPKCEAEDFVAEARAGVAATLTTLSDMLMLGVDAHRALEIALVLTFLRGRRSTAGYGEWEEHVTVVLQKELT